MSLVLPLSHSVTGGPPPVVVEVFASSAEPAPREADWMNRSACRGADPDLFITPDGVEEPNYPSAEALRYCNPCPVRPECLALALALGLLGVWGGTSTHQRDQLRRKQPRRSCPACGSFDVCDYVYGGEAEQICLACGTNWMC